MGGASRMVCNMSGLSIKWESAKVLQGSGELTPPETVLCGANLLTPGQADTGTSSAMKEGVCSPR